MYPPEIKNKKSDYDYIFCGAGASASLLLLELNRLDLLREKRILLIDKEIKNRKLKTFCFWCEENEAISKNLHEVISYSWDSIIDTNQKPVEINPLQYNQVSSSHLYQKIESLSNQYNWENTEVEINEISSDEWGPFIQLDGKVLRASFIFDSRNPRFINIENKKPHLHQSFIGWIIDTQDPIQYETSIRLMDFEIEQQNQTQFVYVLPYSQNKALVEITRFGVDIIEPETAKDLLHQYISREFGNYQIVDEECGCIPMTQCQIEQEQLNGVIYLGSKNYNIKPSTGYAFKNMYTQAKSISTSIKNGENPMNQIQKVAQSRFAFYDSLLLDILHHTPEKGKQIFVQLFKQTQAQLILKFLDEKTSLKEEVSIFIHLNWIPFLKSLFNVFIKNKNAQPLILVIVSSFLLIMGRYTNQLNLASSFLIIFGLIAIGIPHGAVDHLLTLKNKTYKSYLIFIGKYLLLFSIMFSIWQFHPLIALFIFMIYSSFHFGSGDSRLFCLNLPESFLWGLTVLLYILGTHLSETNHLLQFIAHVTMPFSIPNYSIFIWIPAIVYKRNLPHFLTLCWLFASGFLPLLISFFIYFIGQHSYWGWRQLQTDLNLKSKTIWLNALPFHAAAWLILGLFYYGFANKTQSDFQQYMSQFFIFISCISFPHVFFLYSFSRKN